MTTVLDFCTPAVPGETHKYYGYSHNKYIKLPQLANLPPPPIVKQQNKSNELKTLRSVALSGNLALLRQFLQLVPDPFKAVNDPHPATGLTCLHFAATRGHLKIVQCLVEEYAVRVDSVDKEGETALLKAAYNGHYHVVHYLLESHANIHQKDKDGWTALHNACSRGYLRIVRSLVDKKAKVDARSKMGHTPLINAASKGHMSIVEFLLDEAHANPLIKNNFGEAAYDVSAAANESYICEMLEKGGRKWWHHQHTEGVLNPSNKRASRFGAVYDLLEFHVTVIVILHENQRATSLLGLSRPQFNEANLTKSDARGAWSLHPEGTYTTKEMVQLPKTSTNNHRISCLSNWFWLTDWQIDYTDPRVDPTSGWQYAKSFEEEDAKWTPVVPTSGYNWVRRRRWVRVMKRRMDLTKGNHRGENVIIADQVDEEDEEEEIQSSDDYVAEANEIIQTVKPDPAPEGDTNTIIEVLTFNMAKYEDAIKVLQSGISSDENEFRKHQASILIKSYTSQTEKLKLQSADTTLVQPTEDALTLDYISDSSLEINPPNKKVWEADASVKACRLCERKFGLLQRRHHCRKCGMVVCDKCSPWKIFLNATEIVQDPDAPTESVAVLNTTQQRVCERCYYHE